MKKIFFCFLLLLLFVCLGSNCMSLKRKNYKKVVIMVQDVDDIGESFVPVSLKDIWVKNLKKKYELGNNGEIQNKIAIYEKLNNLDLSLLLVMIK